jgi:hypothetical protein
MTQPLSFPPNAYYAAAPDGRRVKIAQELFEMLYQFQEEKRSGSARLEFHSGGVAGIEQSVRLK